MTPKGLHDCLILNLLCLFFECVCSPFIINAPFVIIWLMSICISSLLIWISVKVCSNHDFFFKYVILDCFQSHWLLVQNTYFIILFICFLTPGEQNKNTSAWAIWTAIRNCRLIVFPITCFTTLLWRLIKSTIQFDECKSPSFALSAIWTHNINGSLLGG